ncbi:MAG: sodium:solute symporter family protein [Verrucomicrobiales bacterium]
MSPAPDSVESANGIAFTVIGVYLVMLLVLGWMGHRANKPGEEDYYLAGRKQRWLVSTLTIMATFLSSFALLGAPGMVYREGVVFALVSLNIPVAGFCIYTLGRRIWKAGRDGGFVTPADMICDHYKSPVALRLLVALTGLLFVLPYVIMQIKAGGDLAAVLFRGQENAYEIGAVVLASITALYIMIGGMRSVAWTDSVQCVLLLGGMLLAGIAMTVAMGGPSGFAKEVADLPESSLTVPGNTGLWKLPFLLSVCLLMPIGGILQPAQWMRFYSADGPRALRRSALIFIFVLTGCFLFGVMPVGLGGQAQYPLQITADGVSPAAEVGVFDQILVVVAREQLPVLFGSTIGLVIATLLIVATMAASMSTADSNLHALSAVVTRDLYANLFRPKAGERERLWVGRLTVIIATTISLVMVIAGSRPESSLAGFMEMIVGLALFAVAFSVQLLPITIDLLFVKRGTRAGAVSGLAVGLVFAFAFTSLFPLFVGGDSTLMGLVGTAKLVFPIHAAAWGLIPNALIFVIVSFAQNRKRPV